MILRFRLLGIVPLLLAAGACQRSLSHRPQRRELTVTTVPLLVKEARRLYPFLAVAFAPGGVLEGKEVYGFSPSTLTVVEGDTVHFTLINPEDDEHGFFIPECSGRSGESFVLPDLRGAATTQQPHAGDVHRPRARDSSIHVHRSEARAHDARRARRAVRVRGSRVTCYSMRGAVRSRSRIVFSFSGFVRRGSLR